MSNSHFQVVGCLGFVVDTIDQVGVEDEESEEDDEGNQQLPDSVFLHQWVVEVDHLLDGSALEEVEVVSLGELVEEFAEVCCACSGRCLGCRLVRTLILTSASLLSTKTLG